MRYLEFTIENYRAIVGPLRISAGKAMLTPIIGVNESGKTTVLHAVFSFDYLNDDLNGGRHLRDTANLYRTKPEDATVEASIDISKAEIVEAVSECLSKAADEVSKELLGRIKSRRVQPHTLRIKRNLKTKIYAIADGGFGTSAVQDLIAREIIRNTPYILFFDDFRDKVEETIEIVKTPDGGLSEWLAIVEQLFRQTDDSLSVFHLPTMEARQRKTVLSKVRKRLNSTLTKEWQNFRLDDRDALEISLEYLEQPGPRYFLKMEVEEVDRDGNSHYFYISDRSKGFYWFFNFVMKLEFNHKVVDGNAPTLYLLDEPGSYLHALAQTKLCRKLRQLAKTNRVLFCTHSQYLLDPETIPPSSIQVAERGDDGSVALVPLVEYDGSTAPRRSALQPVLDALQLKPFALDLISTRTTILVEGIYDYFCLELFKGARSVSILPSVNAESIKYYISLLIAWRVDFRAIWDNDSEGIARLNEATALFGDEMARRSFRLLPMRAGGRRRIVQNLFDGNDLAELRRALGMPDNCSFERTIQSLYYSSDRGRLLQQVSAATQKNFTDVFDALNLSSD